MAIDLSDHELTALDRALAGRERELTILGYDEISAVVAWPTSGGEVLSCRRMPPFSDEDRLIASLVTVEESLEALVSQGVRPVETVVRQGLQWLRRLDRFWQRSICRREYPFLLRERIERDV